jgi:putative ABC transport system ATP-binding protein
VNLDQARRLQSAAAVSLNGVQFAWPGQGLLLDIEDLTIGRGEYVFLQGVSGSGKTTLLILLGGVLVPQRGRVDVLGTELSTLRGAARDRFRADHIGFVFQQFNLLPYLTVRENILLSCRFSRARAHIARRSSAVSAEADRLLGALGLDPSDFGDRPVTALSIGQQQRVAAARALIGEPELLIADEPTSSLDADARTAFLSVLFSECSRAGTTVVFVSHDLGLAPLFDRTIRLTAVNRAARTVEI